MSWANFPWLRNGWCRSCTVLIVGAIGSSSHPAEINFKTFEAAAGLELAGAASIVNGHVLRLTPAKRNKTGAAWLRQKASILSRFETTFQFLLSHPARVFGGADGLAFVIQNSGPNAVGGPGSAGGFGVADALYSHQGGIPWSFAVFFDTWQNQSEGDPSDNYIAIRSTGRSAEMHWPAERLAFTPKLAIKLTDRAVHTARIVYERPVIQIFLDEMSVPVLQSTLDLSLVADPSGKAWVGFTASTGWGFQNHDILSWSFRGEEVSSDITMVSSEISFPMSECLPDRNLCTPEQSFVRGQDGHYHVVLPGNLQWGVSISNPKSANPEVTNAHGIVCWDLRERASRGCTGPSGAEGHAGTGFLDPTAPPGALIIQRRSGRLWFSVNGRTSSEFKNNEGFYEFDVALQAASSSAR